jgi:hypothetical protein
MFLRNAPAGLLLALLLVVMVVYTSTAAPSSQIEPPTGPATKSIDVVVVLDDSGSMATCWPWPQQGTPFEPPCRAPSVNDPSDPEELRYSAARLLIHLADSADRLAVIRFDSSVEGVGVLGELQEAGSAERRRILASSLQPPIDYLPRGYTRLDLGLESALRLLESNRQPNRSQYVLLLTDGEPTAPGNAPGLETRFTQYLDQLREEDVLVFPVVLCNPSAGCSGDFLRAQFGADVREAQTAADLLRVFSEIFASMKPDRSVVTARNTSGYLSFNTRDAQDVGQLAFVSPRASISSVRREESPIVTQSLLEDGNIDLNVVSGDVPAGAWIVETADPSAFAVVQADSYPELIFPPPSVPNSPASVRYYPAGSAPLIVARGAGPAAGEPLLLDGQTVIPTLGGNRELAAMPLPAGTTDVTLQLGEDRTPFQFRSSFTLEGRADLPRVEVFSPAPGNPGLLEDGRMRLEAGFGPGVPIGGLQATVYVSDITADDAGLPVYSASMSCVDRICANEGFSPADGRNYSIRFLLGAVAGDLHFGDWIETTLDVEPAVYLRGLPDSLDLGQMPADGWAISILAGTTDDIGTINGSLTLNRVDTGEVAPEATLRFSEEVDENEAQSATFRVDGLDQLRPGQYTGEITLTAMSPAGRPMDVKIRPAPVLPVTLIVERSAARVGSQIADFGETTFETSPNFRIDQEVMLPVTFGQGRLFRVSATLAESSCPALTVTSGELQPQGDGYVLPVRLRSSGPVEPGACSGQIQLSGPNEDFDIFPSQIDYRLRVRNLAWTIAGALNFGDLNQAGERSTQTLLVRFDGATPFTIKMLDLSAAGEVEDGAVDLSREFVEMLPVEVTGEPNANGFYEVPITLVANRALPLDPLRGTVYVGDLVLGIEGLPGETRTVDIGFRSPTAFQRYVAWWLLPIYSLPLLLCSGPLTLLVLLIVLARLRNSGYSDDEEEPVVTLPTPAFSAEAESAFVTPSFDTKPSRQGDAGTAWGSQWGDIDWSGSPASTTTNASPSTNRNGAAQDDAWSSRW